MIKIIQLLIALICFPFSINLFAFAKPNQLHPQMVIDSISAMMESNEIPGVAVELFFDGKPYSFYFGYANKAKKISVSDKTIFEVGSISKLLTSLLVAQEIDYAKMSLEDPISKYVKNLPDTFDDISLQDLATHTAGLPFEVADEINSRQQLMKFFSTWSPEYNAEEKWIYSNVGIGLLGYALERVSHTNYNQLYRQHITTPLHMQPIGLNVPPYLNGYFAQGYDDEGKAIPHDKEKLFPAASGIKASASDMRRFLAAAIGLPGTPIKVFYPMRLTQTAFVKLPKSMQGLGWQIHPISNETIHELLENVDDHILETKSVTEIIEKTKFYTDALIDKTGKTSGFGAYIAVIPDMKTGIVILANKSVHDAVIVKTAREILFKLNGIAA